MKDIEKIKSEDLAAQVQDANPGNFAIEQEVVALVGATVPQPTEPSADDARELGAQLLVFLRRALTPIQTALRTALAAIYAHLDSRCTAYTPAAYDPFRLPAGPYDPMRPFVPRTLPNLLTAITSFSARKISDLGDCPDGISLAQILGDSNAPITEIKDTNHGWAWNRNLPAFKNLTKINLGCKTASKVSFPSSSLLTHIVADELETAENNRDAQQAYYTYFINNCSGLEKVSFKKLKTYTMGNSGAFIANSTIGGIDLSSLQRIEGYNTNGFINVNGMDVLEIPELTHYAGTNSALENAFIKSCGFKKVIVRKLADIRTNHNASYGAMGLFSDCPNLEEVEIGKVTFSSCFFVKGCPKLIKFIIGENTAVSLDFRYWSPTLDSSNLDQFLQNFREHIALRLTANGSGKTLTLSQAVRNAIHTAESTYGIESIIVTQKGWTISPAPN